MNTSDIGVSDTGAADNIARGAGPDGISADGISAATEAKFEALKEILWQARRAAVAFSGGVDSTFLLQTAADVLGENVSAVTVKAEAFAEKDAESAAAFCRERGIRWLRVDVKQLEIPGFRENPPDRCYLCKKALFTAIRAEAEREMCAAAPGRSDGRSGAADEENGGRDGSGGNDGRNDGGRNDGGRNDGPLVIMEGSNTDDAGDYRPGLRAIRELGIRSPLAEAGLGKAEIRALSKRMGLATWDQPSFACLASRFVYGEEITEEKLRRTERGERLLSELGFTQYRVRVHGAHGDLARIELLPEEFGKVMKEEVRREVAARFKELGFRYTALDLTGYRTGSMNEVLR